MKPINVLSLFDGMRCGWLALDRAGIKVNKYYAAEIDKYAMIVANANYPEAINLGDLTKWREWDIDWASIDLVIGGSPCQGFSFAGKQLAFDDPRSKLFFEFVDILCEVEDHNPKMKFLLENVRMKKCNLDVISEYLDVEPIFINSALVSAQNRQRFYWTNIEGVEVPEDAGIVLADIIEPEECEATVMTDKFSSRQKGRRCLVDEPKSKAVNLSAMEYVKNGRQGDYIKCTKEGHQRVFRMLDNPRVIGVNEDARGFRPYKKDGSGICELGRILKNSANKTNTLTSSHMPKVLVNPASIVGRRINPETGKREDYNKNIPIIQQLEVHEKDKSRCLTTVGKDCLLSELPEGRYTGDDIYYRKLTPIECERLQTVPDNYTNHVSNTQRYRMLGNGWTIDVIAHILRNFQC